MIPSALASQLRNGLFDFLRYSFWSSTPGFENAVEELISRSGAVNKGPYVSMKLPFVSGTRPDFFPDIPLGFLPHAHQEQAFERLGPERKRSTLVATGTGSGKTESFLIPILQHCLNEVSVRGIKAILIYPMNALATDQAGRIARMIHDNPKLRGLVTAGLFIGESKAKRGPGEAQMGRDHIITDREVLKSSPPDILLTNYKMLDYLLLRPIDQKIWQHNARGVLRFLVVDELHTFDGAQGTDLACLIRRLKRRLGADDGARCCVGTSATLGGGDAKERLLDYAGQVFGEGFDDEAIIGESRLTAEGFLKGFEMAHTEKPTAEDLPILEWDVVTQPAQWLRNQERLWFGDELTHGDDIERRVVLGERLRRHAAVRSLVGLLDGRVLPLSDIIAHLAQRDSSWRANECLAEASMVSLLALISSARRWTAEVPAVQREREAAGGPRPHRPLVEMRIQLWQREMRRMVSSVSNKPRLEFSDDLDREARRSHLPAVHCRDCGAMGWATVIDLDKKSNFHCDLSSFYRAFFRKDPHVRFVYPASAAPQGDPLWDARPQVILDTKTLSMIDPDGTPKGEALPVVVVASSRQTDSGPQLSRDCPFCAARESLTLVGFRAATLTSVFVDQVFASRFNDVRDKKLLTFSDSVQDAAHRAGFFGARTWRSSLRVALRRSLTEMESPTLADLQREFPRYWRSRLPEETFVSTFIAPNMEWLHDWDTLTREGRLPPGSDLLTLIEKRLAFEVASELGLDAGIGRSLIRTRSAAVFVDPKLLQNAVVRLLEPLQNEVPGLRNLTADRLRAFLLGCLHHLRMRGGIDHPQLPRRFVESAGSDAYVFYQTHYLPAFGATSRLPALLTDIPGSRHFDTWTGARRGGSGWYERYLARALKVGALGPDAASFYPLARELLCDVGLLRVTEAKKGGKIWGASCDAFRVTTDTAQVRCDICDHRVTVARHELDGFCAVPCLTGWCEGHYSPVPSDAPDFFGQLYAEAHLQAFLLGDETQHVGLGWRLLDALERERKQRRSLGEKTRTIAKEIDKLKAQVARSLTFEDRLGKLEEESEALTALVKAVDGRQTLEFLTGEGLLPNYAFPESSVRLSSVIWRKKKKAPQKGSKYDTWTYEYARSPGSALAELAPGADFYAGGRRVTVDQVDVSVTEVEHWRFCDNCNHSQRLGLGAEPTSCPACGSKKFIDTQQRMHLLPLRQVFANAPDKNSRIRDDRDERQPRFFQRQILVEFREEESQGAWHIDEKKLPFGFEFLRCARALKSAPAAARFKKRAMNRSTPCPVR